MNEFNKKIYSTEYEGCTKPNAHDGYSGGYCNNGHVIFWAGDPYYEIPDGYPCTCGLTVMKWETCPTCGHRKITMVEKERG